MPKRRKYTQEFKAKAVKACKKTWKTVAKVARELDVGSSVLGRWIKEYNEKESATLDSDNLAPYGKDRFDLNTD